MAKTKKTSKSSSTSIQQKTMMKTRSQTEQFKPDDQNKLHAPKNDKDKEVSVQKSADTLALDKSEQRKVAKQTKKIKKGIEDGSIIVKRNLREAKKRAAQRRGLVYIGHIPHGFYEKQMKNYFKQFGKVTNVKVCRSRVSGNAKGYGYVEFENPEVAKIAAETMNNYVMFKKRIVTEYVPYEKRPKHLFQGKSSQPEHTSVKSRRGKQKHTRNMIQDDATVVKKTKAAFQRFQKKLNKLNQLGIVCNTKPVHVDTNIIGETKTGKVKKAKVAKINNDAIRKIARDLVRKRGNPLVNVKPSKIVNTGKVNKK
ncbi:uncharacterized protein LOC126734341 [Anthonomus grandis grandis]|uniref:uncharacterized protein LOC126734341 n=1 Tax=Anthonomus grandis grandis TaxID=2921223 RepID=UPI0021658CA0|nr:uncharacterized protein LOC126734341 [Anthonomus grandis grandis]